MSFQKLECDDWGWDTFGLGSCIGVGLAMKTWSQQFVFYAPSLAFSWTFPQPPSHAPQVFFFFFSVPFHTWTERSLKSWFSENLGLLSSEREFGVAVMERSPFYSNSKKNTVLWVHRRLLRYQNHRKLLILAGGGVCSKFLNDIISFKRMFLLILTWALHATCLRRYEFFVTKKCSSRDWMTAW